MSDMTTTDNLQTRWRLAVLDPSMAVDVDAISDTVESVFAALSAQGAAGVNLTTLPGAVNGEHLAAVLRASSMVREKVPGWDPALELARLALLSAGKDPADALFGMLPSIGPSKSPARRR